MNRVSIREDASNQSTDMESVEMQKQDEDMCRSNCKAEEENASLQAPGPEGLHTMLGTHHLVTSKHRNKTGNIFVHAASIRCLF